MVASLRRRGRACFRPSPRLPAGCEQGERWCRTQGGGSTEQVAACGNHRASPAYRAYCWNTALAKSSACLSASRTGVLPSSASVTMPFTCERYSDSGAL